jgi:hypothetical protein
MCAFAARAEPVVEMATMTEFPTRRICGEQSSAVYREYTTMARRHTMGTSRGSQILCSHRWRSSALQAMRSISVYTTESRF